MHIKCLKSRNPDIIAGKAYLVAAESPSAWIFYDEQNNRHRANKSGQRWVGAEGWRQCRVSCNPDVESGPGIYTDIADLKPGMRLDVQCTLIPGPPYPARFLGTFCAGHLGSGIMVQDPEGYKIHIWPGTATWEVAA